MMVYTGDEKRISIREQGVRGRRWQVRLYGR